MIIKNLIKLPIFKRLIPSIFKRYIFFTGNYFKSKNISGVTYYLDTRYLIDRNFYLRENYEDYLYSIANKLIILNKVNFFLDIGSCWGIYSLRLSSLKKLRILSFDPILDNIKRLKKMIKINNLRNIQTFNTALGSKKGKVKFYGLEKFTPNYSLYDKKYKNFTISKIDKLDNLIKINKKVLYLKVDIERHEYHFLLGAKNILKKNNIILQIEIHEKNKKKVLNYLKLKKFKFIHNYNADYIFSNFKIKKPQEALF